MLLAKGTPKEGSFVPHPYGIRTLKKKKKDLGPAGQTRDSGNGMNNSRIIRNGMMHAMQILMEPEKIKTRYSKVREISKEKKLTRI